MKDFRKLQVWEKSHHLTVSICKATSSFPRDEMYGLISQMRRSSASIPANIAEGCGRAGDAELCHFLRIAMGSASELEYHVLLAHDLGFLHDAAYQELTENVTEVKRMLATLIQRMTADR